MKYIIMADGEGKRWNDHLGIPKHLVEIGGETLLERTTRLLRENGIQDYIITCSDERYSQYGPTMRQTVRDCEIDRFEESIVDDIYMATLIILMTLLKLLSMHKSKTICSLDTSMKFLL